MRAEGENDLLRGRKAISRFTGLTDYQLRTLQELPLRRLGKLWCMRKSDWLKYLGDTERKIA